MKIPLYVKHSQAKSEPDVCQTLPPVVSFLAVFSVSLPSHAAAVLSAADSSAAVDSAAAASLQGLTVCCTNICSFKIHVN